MDDNLINNILETIIRSFVSHSFIKRPKLGKQKRRYFSGFSVKRFNSELSDAFLNQTTSDDQYNIDDAFFLTSITHCRVLSRDTLL